MSNSQDPMEQIFKEERKITHRRKEKHLEVLFKYEARNETSVREVDTTTPDWDHKGWSSVLKASAAVLDTMIQDKQEEYSTQLLEVTKLLRKKQQDQARARAGLMVDIFRERFALKVAKFYFSCLLPVNIPFESVNNMGDIGEYLLTALVAVIIFASSYPAPAFTRLIDMLAKRFSSLQVTAIANFQDPVCKLVKSYMDYFNDNIQQDSLEELIKSKVFRLATALLSRKFEKGDLVMIPKEAIGHWAKKKIPRNGKEEYGPFRVLDLLGDERIWVEISASMGWRDVFRVSDAMMYNACGVEHLTHKQIHPLLLDIDVELEQERALLHLEEYASTKKSIATELSKCSSRK